MRMHGWVGVVVLLRVVAGACWEGRVRWKSHHTVTFDREPTSTFFAPESARGGDGWAKPLPDAGRHVWVRSYTKILDWITIQRSEGKWGVTGGWINKIKGFTCLCEGIAHEEGEYITTPTLWHLLSASGLDERCYSLTSKMTLLVQLTKNRGGGKKCTTSVQNKQRRTRRCTCPVAIRKGLITHSALSLKYKCFIKMKSALWWM